MAVRLAIWLEKDCLEKLKTELDLDRLPGIMKELASLLGSEEAELDWCREETSLNREGTRS